MNSKYNVEEMSSVLHPKKAVKYLQRKYVLGNFYLRMSYSVVGHELILVNQWYVLNEGSLNRSTHKTVMYWLKKIC